MAKLPPGAKAKLEKDRHWSRDCVARWIKLKPKLMRATRVPRRAAPWPLFQPTLEPIPERLDTIWYAHAWALMSNELKVRRKQAWKADGLWLLSLDDSEDEDDARFCEKNRGKVPLGACKATRCCEFGPPPREGSSP